jgi:hypothetical protein
VNWNGYGRKPVLSQHLIGDIEENQEIFPSG